MAVSPHVDFCVPLLAFLGMAPETCHHLGELHIAPPAQTLSGAGGVNGLAVLELCFEVRPVCGHFRVQPVQIPEWVSYGRK